MPDPEARRLDGAAPPHELAAPPHELAGYITGLTVPLDIQLGMVAGRQHAVFALDQVVAAGLTASGARKRLADGRLYRVFRGVYSLVPPELLGYKGRFMAAVLACGPGAALSHRSAADLLDLRPTQSRTIHVTVPHRNARRHEGVVAHRSTTLIPADVTEVDGIPCTNVARTTFDLCDELKPPDVERVLNQADILQVIDVTALDDQIARNPGRRKAAGTLNAALNLYRPSQAPTERGTEERLLALIRSAGLPEPERQVWFYPPDAEPFRVDFAWTRQRLVVEADSRRFHDTAQAYETDRRRDQHLQRLGWRVIRITWRQVVKDPASVGRLLAELLQDDADGADSADGSLQASA